MPHASDYEQRLRAVLAQRIEHGADVAEVAAVSTRALASIAATLNPIIGKAGVAALYKRSIHLASLTHPWLSGSDRGGVDMTVLGASLAEHGVAEAAEAGITVLQTFCGLLTSLVGATLTDRLLHGVWADL